MTQYQIESERCGMIPEENPPEFFAKHLSAYHFMKRAAVGKTILEIGFGDGYGMNYLSGAARELTGLDIVSNNIPLAQKKYPKKNLSFICFDGKRFPFSDKSFDMVASFQVIEHIPESALVDWLTEIKRVLKDGGSFRVSTLNLQTARKPGVAYEKNRDHEKEFTAPELEALLKKVFGKVQMYGLHYATRHRFFKSLKKWGLLKVGFVKRHFQQVTVDDFVVREDDFKGSVDLFAVCDRTGL